MPRVNLSWMPPSHLAPHSAWLTDPVVLLLALLAHHPIIVGLSMIPLAIGLGKLLPSLTSDSSKSTRRRHVITASMMIVAVCNLVFGTLIANALIYQTGESSGATIMAAHQTASVYNNKYIVSYQIAFRTRSGRLMMTHFDNDEFNVYPSHNATLYPSVGSEFTVRYLKHAPTEFVIVENDESPLARNLRLGRYEITTYP